MKIIIILLLSYTYLYLQSPIKTLNNTKDITDDHINSIFHIINGEDDKNRYTSDGELNSKGSLKQGELILGSFAFFQNDDKYKYHTCNMFDDTIQQKLKPLLDLQIQSATEICSPLAVLSDFFGGDVYHCGLSITLYNDKCVTIDIQVPNWPTGKDDHSYKEALERQNFIGKDKKCFGKDYSDNWQTNSPIKNLALYRNVPAQLRVREDKCGKLKGNPFQDNRCENMDKKGKYCEHMEGRTNITPEKKVMFKHLLIQINEQMKTGKQYNAGCNCQTLSAAALGFIHTRNDEEFPAQGHKSIRNKKFIDSMKSFVSKLNPFVKS